MARSELKHTSEFNYTTHRLDKNTQAYLSGFCCGHQELDRFLFEDALQNSHSGNGVTHLVVDTSLDRLMGYYTFETSGIKDTGRGIDYLLPCAEIKMFAVDNRYQDTLYEGEQGNCLLSSCILRVAVGHLYELSQYQIGFNYILLRSVPEAVNFYKANCFELLSDYGVFYDDYAKGCIPMFMKLYEE